MGTNVKNKKSFIGIWCKLSLEDLPKTVCSLWINLIISMILSPLWFFPAGVMNILAEKYPYNNNFFNINYWMGIVINIAILAIGARISCALHWFTQYNTFTQILCCLFIGYIYVIAFVLCLYFIIRILGFIVSSVRKIIKCKPIDWK